MLLHLQTLGGEGAQAQAQVSLLHLQLLHTHARVHSMDIFALFDNHAADATLINSAATTLL